MLGQIKVECMNVNPFFFNSVLETKAGWEEQIWDVDKYLPSTQIGEAK